MSSDEGKFENVPKPGSEPAQAGRTRDKTTTMNMKIDVGESSPNEAPSGLEASDALGRQLKKVYGKLLNEPVPDKFFDLLRRLDHHPTPAPKAESGTEND